jgi:ribosome-associated toxin RatA of RatAB toxin-antitoxin module
MSLSVRVKHKETTEESIITYKAYVDTSQYYELIGQVDDYGNIVPGNPNLEARHQRVAKMVVRDVVHADDEAQESEVKEEHESEEVATEVVKDLPKAVRKQPARKVSKSKTPTA